MAIMATKILSGWCWQSTIRHFLPPPRLFPVTSRHLAHPQFVPDNHQHRGFLNIWEGGRRRIPPFQFRPIVTSSWKSINFSTHFTVKWAGIENWKILSPILSFFNVQTFHCVLVKISRENVLSVVVTLTPISSISPLTLLTYFTTIPTLHTKHVSSWLVLCLFQTNQCDLVQWQKSATSQAGQTRPREAALPSWHCSGIFRRIFRIRQIFSGHC